MNTVLIRAFAETLKKNKNGFTKQKRKLVAKINNSSDHIDFTINPLILQQTGYTSDGKITVR
jgi:hypothetical protein